MSLHKKILIFLIVALILIVVLFGGIFAIFNRAANTPATNFRGPNSAPYAEGPNGPPPSSY